MRTPYTLLQCVGSLALAIQFESVRIGAPVGAAAAGKLDEVASITSFPRLSPSTATPPLARWKQRLTTMLARGFARPVLVEVLESRPRRLHMTGASYDLREGET